MKNIGGVMPTGGLIAGTDFRFNSKAKAAATVTTDRVAADPTNIPGPLTHTSAKTHNIELVTKRSAC